MLKSKLSVLLIAIFSLMFIANIEAQLSKKHFIPPLTNSQLRHSCPASFISSKASTKSPLRIYSPTTCASNCEIYPDS